MKVKDFLYKLDDRVKVWMAVSAGGVAIYCIDWFIQALILFICLCLCVAVGAKRFVAGFIMVFIFMGVMSLGLQMTLDESTYTGMGLVFLLVKFGSMFAMMVFIQTSLNTSKFLHLLERMHLSSRYAIPLGVCLRFMPSIVAETRQVRYALRMRGIRLFSISSIKHPFVMLGYMMTPILVRSLAIGEELARSAVARGIESPGPKTSIHEAPFRTVDGIIFTVWSLLFIAFVIVDNHLYTQSISQLHAALIRCEIC